MAVLQKTVHEVLEPRTYDATISAVEDAEGQFGPQIKFTFDLGGGHALWGWAAQKLSPGSKLGKWVAALTGAIPDALDTSTLVGKRCRVKVDSDVRADGTEFNKVSGVLAPRERPAEQI